jgi:hypothetical protein
MCCKKYKERDLINFTFGTIISLMGEIHFFWGGGYLFGGEFI